MTDNPGTPDLRHSFGDRRALRNAILTVLLWIVALAAAVPLVSVLYMLVARGGARLGTALFTQLPPAGLEMGGGVCEAFDLPVLGLEVPDRVVDEVDEPEGTVDPHRGHVADRDGNGIRTRLGSKLRHHVGRELDPADRHAMGGER
jgi:hypothetical protein